VNYLCIYFPLLFFPLFHILSELKELEAEKAQIRVKDEDTVAEYYHLRVQLQKLKQNLRDFMNQAVYSVPFLQPGRLVKVINYY
jgi:ATP-dependent RNA helicase DOB1